MVLRVLVLVLAMVYRFYMDDGWIICIGPLPPTIYMLSNRDNTLIEWLSYGHIWVGTTLSGLYNLYSIFGLHLEELSVATICYLYIK